MKDSNKKLSNRKATRKDVSPQLDKTQREPMKDSNIKAPTRKPLRKDGGAGSPQLEKTQRELGTTPTNPTNETPSPGLPIEALEVTPRQPSVSQSVAGSANAGDLHVINLDELMAQQTSFKHKKSNIKVPAENQPTKEVINQEQFDLKYGFRRVNLSLGLKFSYHFRKIGKWRCKEWIRFFRSRMPISLWLPDYSFRQDLMADIVGGLMVSIMCVPQGLAYGMLVGVPPIYGLYTSIFGPIIYALFGSSRHCSPGSFAIVSLMVGTVVQSVGNSHAQDPQQIQAKLEDDEYICCCTNAVSVDSVKAVGIATSTTFLVGICQLIFGLLNAGILAVWLSDQLVQGLTSGAAIHVLTSQMKSMTGVRDVPPTDEAFGLIKFYICFVAGVTDGSWAVTICSLTCVVLLLISSYAIDPVLRKWVSAKFPMEFILVVGATLLNRYTNVKLPKVGVVQGGIVPPKFPPLNEYPFEPLISSAISIAIISFVIHIALAKLVSKKFNYQIDANQEWFALGAMHALSSFFGCFAGGSSLGRTMTQVKFCTRSQMSTIICVLIVTLVVFFAAPLIEHLPKSVLACIVVMAMKDLIIQIFKMATLFQQSIVDFLIFTVTFSSVLLFNVNIGLVVGICFALLSVIFRTQWAESTLMGRIEGTFDFKGLGHYKQAKEIDGIIVFRFDAPLYFANAETFLEKVHLATGLNPVLVRASMNQTESSMKTKKKSKKKKQEKKEKKKNDGSKQSLLPSSGSNSENNFEIVVKHREVKVESSKRSRRTDVEKEVVPHAEDSALITHLIIDCSSIPYIDMMGLDALQQVHADYSSIHITVFYAHCKVAVRQFIENCGYFKRSDEQQEKASQDNIFKKRQFFVSIPDAVAAANMERQQKKSLTLYNVVTKTNAQLLPQAKSPGQQSRYSDLPIALEKRLAEEARTQPLNDERDLAPVEQTATMGEMTATDHDVSEKSNLKKRRRTVRMRKAPPKTDRDRATQREKEQLREYSMKEQYEAEDNTQGNEDHS